MIKKNFLTFTGAICLITSVASTSYASSEASNSAQIKAQAQNQTEVKAAEPAAQSASPELSQIMQVTEAWARKSLSPNNNSAAYMKINNLADKDLVIIGASASEIANNVELHKSFVDEKGVSRMTTIDKIVVPAKTTVELAPSGTHIMLFDLKRNLNIGDKFKLELKVEGEVKPIIVETEVKEGK